MNFSEVTQHFVLLVVLMCLVVGYIIKHATFLKWIPNDDIPLILAICGVIANCIVSGITFEAIVYGAVMGLSSTGLHQQFSRWIESVKENGED